MLIVLCIIAILLFASGTTLLVFSLGYPQWYKKVWDEHIESPVPDNLINLTTLLGAIISGIGFILMIIYIIKSETPEQKFKRASKTQRKKGIVLIKRKLNKGPKGGKYYVTRKCNRRGCRNIKNYI